MYAVYFMVQCLHILGEYCNRQRIIPSPGDTTVH